MKKTLGGLHVQRMLLQGRHGNLIDPSKRIISYLYRKTKKDRTDFPYMVAVEVTNDCMLNCVMCPRSQLDEKTGYMSFDLFGKIIDECSRRYWMDQLVFTGMGEPLLHPQIIEMSKFAKKRGVPWVRLTTNAVLLTEKKTAEILENSGLDQISISLDALTPETYNRIKRDGHFQTVQNNIVSFLDQRRKKGLWKPFLNLHILKMRETASEVGGFVRKWNSLLQRGDHILVKEFHTFAEQVEDRRLEDQIHVGKRFPCLQLWGLSYIAWNGDVMPCCIDALRKLRIGNLQEATIHELWNNPCIEKIRETHVQRLYKQIPLCRGCGNWWYLGKKPK